MPARTSESFVLRTYPYGEADLIVSFLTRDQGKLRGAAKRARRPKSSFGAGLERLSLVRMQYIERENRELVTLLSCELIRSPFGLLSSYETGLALDYIAEVTDELLPPHEQNDRHFRLLLAISEFLLERARTDSGACWTAVLYFALWSARLSGFLPALEGKQESLAIAREMFEKPIRDLTPREWTRHTGADLRRFLNRVLEEAIERRLRVAPMLESL